MSDEVNDETNEIESVAEAQDENSKPYYQQILDGELEAPPFVHISDDGVFTDYTLEEVISCDQIVGRKSLWINQRINKFKGQLRQSDYIAIKIAEGAATADEYAEQIAARQGIRDTINEYQDALNALEEEVEQ